MTMNRILVEQHGQREIRDFPRLFTVGRRPDCAIVVGSQEIDAVQARIDQIAGRFLLCNLGKAGRVFVNGSAVDVKRIVEPSDQIEIGDARITLLSATANVDSSSIRLRCTCGAGLLVRARYAGQVKHCPRCNVGFTVPSQNETAPVNRDRGKAAGAQEVLNRYLPEPSVPAQEAICPVCQCTVVPDEEQTVCPACGLPHHSDCWNENLGCSAYGCSQVGVLKQGPDIRIPLEGIDIPQTPPGMPLRPVPPPVENVVPWEFAFLGLSVLCFVVGTVTFGMSCLLAGAVIAAFVLSREGRVNWVVIGFAGLTCFAGLIAGIVISIHVYLN
jgi:hypothetical protein